MPAIVEIEFLPDATSAVVVFICSLPASMTAGGMRHCDN
jgi:hypothetical protein